jgi:hypothetical protein
MYLAEFAPEESETLRGLLGRYAPTPALPYFDQQGDIVWLKQEGVRTAFAQDMPQEEADIIWAVQKKTFGRNSSNANQNSGVENPTCLVCTGVKRQNHQSRSAEV